MRLLTLAAVAAAPLLLLAACDQIMPAPAPAPDPAPPPAPASVLGGVDLSQPFTALGQEPGWAILVTPAMLDYSVYDQDHETTANPGPQLATGIATYTVTTSLGNPLVLVLTVGPCMDSMESTVYPLSATVFRAGQIWTGCARQ